jgi:hypothetical protein
MKTYNIETPITIEVIKADSMGITQGGSIFFKNKQGEFSLVLNQSEWKRVWLVKE